MSRRSQGGFTLIELMIVVVIIGILAALAIPRFMQASAKTKQHEAKTILKTIYTHERAYKVENGLFGDISASAKAGGEFSQIGVEIPDDARYTYTISETPTDGLLITATANLDNDATVDTWTIDSAGKLVCTINDLSS